MGTKTSRLNATTRDAILDVADQMEQRLADLRDAAGDLSVKRVRELAQWLAIDAGLMEAYTERGAVKREHADGSVGYRFAPAAD